jgi:thioredoxin 1
MMNVREKITIVSIISLSLLLLLIFIIPLLSNINKTTNQKSSGTTNTDAYKTDKEDPAVVKKGNPSYKVTFIELGSVRCIPCKMMQPIMREIEDEYGDQVNVVFHDVWTPEGKPYAAIYNIQAIPTQVFLDAEGKEYYRHTGFFPKEALVKVLKQKGVKKDA